MKKGLRFLGTLGALLSIVGLAGAQSGYMSEGRPESFVRVMNVGSAPATIQVDYYNESLTGANASKTEPNVPVNVGAAFAPRLVSGFPPTFSGSAVAAGDQEIAAASYLNWTSGGYARDGIGYAGYSGVSAPGSSFYVPLISRRGGPNPEHSAITVQNADASQVTVDIKFFDRNTGAEITAAAQVLTIEPNRQKTVNTTSLTSMPEGTLASATVTARDSKKIAVVGTTYALMDPESFVGISSGGTKLSFARALRAVDASGNYLEYSGIVVQNIDPAQTAEVMVTFYDRDGNQKLQFPDSIPAFTSHGYNTRYQANIPNSAWSTIDTTLGRNFLGSVTVESTNGVNIVGLNRNWNATKNLQNAFNAQTAGGNEIYFPYFYRQATGGDINGNGTWQKETGLVVQNLNTTTAANITVQIYSLDGSLAYQFNDVVQPNSSRGYNSRYINYTNWPNRTEANTELGFALDGTVKVTSDQPVVGVGFITFNGLNGAVEFDAYSR